MCKFKRKKEMEIKQSAEYHVLALKGSMAHVQDLYLLSPRNDNPLKNYPEPNQPNSSF